MQAWKGTGAALGIACIVATNPLVAFASPISGSADAPDQSIAKEGEDKQPPGFKYTHMWYFFSNGMPDRNYIRSKI
jgi:hypothetical protein